MGVAGRNTSLFMRRLKLIHISALQKPIASNLRRNVHIWMKVSIKHIISRTYIQDSTQTTLTWDSNFGLCSRVGKWIRALRFNQIGMPRTKGIQDESLKSWLFYQTQFKTCCIPKTEVCDSIVSFPLRYNRWLYTFNN